MKTPGPRITVIASLNVPTRPPDAERPTTRTWYVPGGKEA
jgi:hypothetical protein